MRTVFKIIAVAVVLLMGPTMYVVSRTHTLELGFSRVRLGDGAAAVEAAMGRPQEQTSAGSGNDSQTEYRYSARPYPRVWVIAMRDGKVVGKALVER